ncbi:MAG TPA: RNA polymerase sigma factor [Acidimicrobiales bacterium]|nr:RNA polymerase sigma factor [Acidimicrobiales bacterium]
MAWTDPVAETGDDDDGAPCGPADDEALVRRAREDPDAFGLLFRRHWPAIYAFAHRRCGSREVAEEVTSATFERAWRALPGFEWKGGGIRPWLFRIAASELAGWYRRERRHRSPRAQMAMRELAGSADFDGPGGDLDEPVRAALARIRPRYQQAVTLRYLAGLSTEEAAAALGCSRPTFAVTLHRALRALRSALSEGGTP